ncbi:hypothetical protein ACTI_46820 [Actinoplanes sp. OR16]|uniref:pyridoxal-phosphate dependent enzyme n=1 Tax=Actinoplanes sp. OR16 TaxID=946334 RepID=UPI000F6C9F73|nr:pyridoxal-phosphate dependent enzyme [Actinoplanes sp. OR16]BBH67997.1 hypothetical protein ACTI_46820 [Actinoplanes sp. OR16]
MLAVVTDEVRRFHAGLPGYAPTPLHELPALAAELGVGRVLVKDESSRFGLPAFKVLGASWAINRLLSEMSPEEMGREGGAGKAGRDGGRGTTRLVTASDGNHGRAVARVAKQRGLEAHVFVPSGVHPSAIAAIEAEGAQVSTIAGSYDDAVRAAAEAGGTLVQDTAWPGYERIPQWIVDGYSTLFAEIMEQLGAAPDVLIMPVGVGSLAQAGTTYFAEYPTLLVAVEPTNATFLGASREAGEPVTTDTSETVMAGLNCGTVSSLAWPYLKDRLDRAVTVTDAQSLSAAEALRLHGISAGPCGAAALAAARTMTLAPGATVVLLSTEGADANPWDDGANPGDDDTEPRGESALRPYR